MAVGELATAPGFTLFGGVHALEIGNERMDTGLKYKPLQEEISNAPKINNSEDFEEFIDSLISREISWHCGAMLMQNVLSCVYVEDILEKIFNRFNSNKNQSGSMDEYLEEFAKNITSWSDAAQACIIGLVKNLNLCIGILNDPSAIYQEEDIILNNAGYHFLDNTPTDKVIHVLKSALTWMKNQEAPKSSKNRVELRIQLLHTMSRNTPENRPHISKALKLIKDVVPRENGNKYDSTSYTEGVQARVTNTSPLRPLKSESEPYSRWEEILTMADEISGTVPDIVKSTDLLSFFLKFSAKRPRPLPIVRGLLKSIVNNGSILSQSQIQWVTQDIKELTSAAPGSILETDHSQIKQIVAIFMEQAALCYTDLLTVMCQNRSRQRQNLAHCILSFDSLQVNAEQLEMDVANVLKQDTIEVNGTHVPAMPISSWVYLRKLQIMVWVVFLGFELDVYKLWEYSRMYYYGNFLLNNLEDHLNRLQVYIEQKLQKSPRFQPLKNSQSYIQALQVESNALNQLCQSGMYLAIGFEKSELIKMPAKALSITNPELLYGLRLKPFSSVGVPEKPSFEEFQEAVGLSNNVREAANQSKKFANSCRSFIDNLTKMSQANEELDLLKRSSVGLAISASMLEKGAIPKIQLTREGYHWFFPVISKADK